MEGSKRIPQTQGCCSPTPNYMELCSSRPGPGGKVEGGKMVRYRSLVELEWDVLDLLATNSRPVGAIHLAAILGEKHRTSQAAIGRLLLDLDRRGLTTKVSNQGRTLTKEGQAYCREVHRQRVREHENDAFVQSMTGTSVKTLMDVLVARRALERETARLAAIHATLPEIEELWSVINRQEEELRLGRYGQEPDFEFHNLVAKASRNAVLQHALTVIRSASELSTLTSFIRYRLGGSVAGSHRRIVERIADRDPSGAVQAMDEHISYLLEHIYEYFKSISADVGGPRLDMPSAEHGV